MKNKKCLFLAVMPFLMLTACGETKDDPKPNPGKNDDEDVEVLDEGNTPVTFNEITNLVMINKKAQDYIDAMKEQEKKSENPYMFSALDGIDDLDVKNFLSQNDDKANRPIHISWDATGLEDSGVKLVLSRSWKFTDSVAYDVTDGAADIDNLLRNTTYYYRLENADKSVQSQVQKFTTADYTRTINFKGSSSLKETIYNVRDEGGYVSSFGGVRTNQELIYRGSEINLTTFSYSGSHGINVDDIVLTKNKEILKIKKEIDLRKADAVDSTNAANKSGLDSEDFPVSYVRIPYQSYANFVTDPDDLQDNAIKDVFELFANADQEHAYFHCWGGADRTGALGFFLNGLLGVSYTDLVIDFELTSQNNSLRSHLTPNGSYDFPKFIKAIKDDDNYAEDKSIAQFCYDWLVGHGVEAETLEKIRTIMIPGYEAGMEQTL